MVCCCVAFSVLPADLEEQAGESTETSDPQFSVLDTMAAVQAYRDDRRRQIIEGLSSSALSEEHQELLASAMSKMYAGVPLSSFTHSERQESSGEEPTESSFEYFVSEEGRIRHESEGSSQSLNLTSTSPFMFLPLLPFDAATGRVVEESDAEAMFVFDFDISMTDGENSDFGPLQDKMKWVTQVVVRKQDQSPKTLTMKLDKPVRARLRFRVKTISMTLDYTYIESCDGFAVNKTTMEMDASVIFMGKLQVFAESTFTDIECTDPILYLLPKEEETSFFQF